jgi:hypothetical protein
MKQINDGGPAFPYDERCQRSGEICGQFKGMTLRDWFAGMALQGIVANPDFKVAFCSPLNDAKNCYALADAMLAARDGKEGK